MAPLRLFLILIGGGSSVYLLYSFHPSPFVFLLLPFILLVGYFLPRILPPLLLLLSFPSLMGFSHINLPFKPALPIYALSALLTLIALSSLLLYQLEKGERLGFGLEVLKCSFPVLLLASSIPLLLSIFYLYLPKIPLPSGWACPVILLWCILIMGLLYFILRR